MKDELIKIFYQRKGGQKELGIIVGTYFDPRHPNRRFCFRRGLSPHTIWFNDARSVQDVMEYLWANEISADAIVDQEIRIIVEKA